VLIGVKHGSELTLAVVDGIRTGLCAAPLICVGVIVDEYVAFAELRAVIRIAMNGALRPRNWILLLSVN
jgi:hypothetical protein